MKTLLLSCFVMTITPAQAQQVVPDSVLKADLARARQHLSGRGQPKDPAAALAIYYQYCAQGNGNVMIELGQVYKAGRWLPRNTDSAAAWFNKAAEQGHAAGWYQLGLLYKDARDKTQDFAKAYGYFCKAADLGDPQSIYAKAYMLYKGLGCIQQYTEAARLFRQGALQGRNNSMYFYALCLRNGYGVPADSAQARQWLEKAAGKGNRMAVQELKAASGENGNEAAKLLARQVQAAILPTAAGTNQYQKVASEVAAEKLTGLYEGYLIQYDWSGKQVINTIPLMLTLDYANGELAGQWVEGAGDAVPLKARLTPRALVFVNTVYTKTDHYSPDRPLAYHFDEAQLQWVSRGDSTLLCGSIGMFSMSRNEPQKPQYVALVKKESGQRAGDKIKLTNTDGSPLSVKNNLLAYPNPFAQRLTVEFELAEAASVQTRLLTTDGRVVYTNPAGQLAPGYYMLTLQPQEVAAGTYLLQLQCGKDMRVAKVVKL